jgi:hypothetical protein
VFDEASKEKTRAFLEALPEDWKNNITVKVTGAYTYGIPTDADETNVPETERHDIDHRLIGIKLDSIEAYYIDGVSTFKLS